KKKKRHDSPKTPPGSPPHQPPPPLPLAGPSRTLGSSRASGSSQLSPPPPSTHQSDQSKSTTALSSSKTVASAVYIAWTTTDTRLKLSVSSIPEALHMDDDTAADEQPLEEDKPAEPAWSIPSSDMRVSMNNWASALASTYTPPPENSLLVQTGDMPIFMDWFYKKQGITELKPQDLEGSAFDIVKVFHPNVIHLKYQIEECHKLLTDKVDESITRHRVSRYGHKGGRPALSISKMKAAYSLDVVLEQMVPDQMWIEEECKYDISTIIEVFSMYGYNYMKKIVLCRADLKEHIIGERDFKYLYPSDFEDLYLLNLQGHLNHLPPKDKKILTTACNLWTRNLVIRHHIEDFQTGIESYQTQLNLTKPRYDATGFEYKHDIIIDEAFDYRVKEFKVNRMNPGLNTRCWTWKDVDRSKEFMFSIKK
nr:hypothetical protein [Tanacetum cinerariifolium]